MVALEDKAEMFATQGSQRVSVEFARLLLRHSIGPGRGPIEAAQDVHQFLVIVSLDSHEESAGRFFRGRKRPLFLPCKAELKISAHEHDDD